MVVVDGGFRAVTGHIAVQSLHAQFHFRQVRQARQVNSGADRWSAGANRGNFVFDHAVAIKSEEAPQSGHAVTEIKSGAVVAFVIECVGTGPEVERADEVSDGERHSRAAKDRGESHAKF